MPFVLNNLKHKLLFNFAKTMSKSEKALVLIRQENLRMIICTRNHARRVVIFPSFLNKKMIMKNNVLISCSCFLFSGFAAGQDFKGQVEISKVPFPAAHYQGEYTFDSTLDMAAWEGEDSGIACIFASTDELFLFEKRSAPY